MYWILTHQEARDNWLLTGWRKDDGARDTKITPYIEFDDSAMLKEFLRLNNYPVTTSQVSTVNWLISNDLNHLGRTQGDPSEPGHPGNPRSIF